MAQTLPQPAQAPPWIALAVFALAAQVAAQRAEQAQLREALAGAYRYSGRPVPEGLVPERRRHLQVVS